MLDLQNRLTVNEVAKKMGKNPETIRRWVREEKVKAIKLGNVFYIEKDSLKEME